MVSMTMCMRTCLASTTLGHQQLQGLLLVRALPVMIQTTLGKTRRAQRRGSTHSHIAALHRFLCPQLRVCLPCLREVQLGYDRGNMDAITAAAPGWPALAGLVKALDLRVYPGPLAAQTLAHLAQLGSGLTRLAISGELCSRVVVGRDLRMCLLGSGFRYRVGVAGTCDCLSDQHPGYL